MLTTLDVHLPFSLSSLSVSVSPSLSLSPLSLPPPLPPPPPHTHTYSGRKHFEYELQEVATNPRSQHPQTADAGPTNLVEEEACSPSSSSEELGNQAGDSPPTELKDEERREIFASRQKLSMFTTSTFTRPFLAFCIRKG